MCPPAVRGMLMNVPGVEECEVSFDDKTATLTVKKGLNPEKLLDAVTGQYSVKIKQ